MTNLASAPAYGRPGVLLTGATGFLGGYLLKELVERTEMPIYCLTRSDGTFGARARLSATVSRPRQRVSSPVARTPLRALT